MTEFPELSIGDLYYSTYNELYLYDKDFKIISIIYHEHLVLIVDNRYYYMHIAKTPHHTPQPEISFNVLQNLEEAKNNLIAIKIAYDNKIGYANFHSFALLDKL